MRTRKRIQFEKRRQRMKNSLSFSVSKIFPLLIHPLSQLAQTALPKGEPLGVSVLGSLGADVKWYTRKTSNTYTYG